MTDKPDPNSFERVGPKTIAAESADTLIDSSRRAEIAIGEHTSGELRLDASVDWLPEQLQAIERLNSSGSSLDENTTSPAMKIEPKTSSHTQFWDS
jgi:hypothetical protein